MGQQETKPVYPSEDQWKAWQDEKNQYLRKEVERLEALRQGQLNKDMVDCKESFYHYMKECHDKSALSRLLLNNSPCTDARDKFIRKLFTTSKNMDTITAEDINNKIRNLRQ